MEPQTILGQAAQSMQAGTPEIGQVSGSSPNFDPGMQPPPSAPMPEKSPASEISPLHRALQRRGMQPPAQSGGQPQEAQVQGNEVTIPASEAELIIKALSGRLKTLSGHEEKLRDAALSFMKPVENTLDESGSVQAPPMQKLPGQ